MDTLDHDSSLPDRSTRGGFLRDGSFWDSWIRLFGSFVLGILSAVFLFGGKSRDLSDLLVWRGKIDSIIESLQSNGTNRSKWINEEQQKEIDGDKQKVEVLEKRVYTLEQWVQPIPGMQQKLERLENQTDGRK